MLSRKTVVAGALALSAFSGGAAQAATLTLNGGWEPFFYVDPNYYNKTFNPTGNYYGGPIYDYYTGDTDFTFTLTQTASLNITDLFYNGDQFDLKINGVDQGATPFVIQPYAYTDIPDLAFASPYFSHASYLLGPGTYAVTGVATFSPDGEGVAVLEVYVPEPGTWALMLIGFGAIGGLARRRARSASATV